MDLKGEDIIQGCVNFINQDIWYSNTAIKHGINNRPSNKQIDLIIKMFQNTVQPLRTLIGHPIKVNSCFRSLKLNSKIGGEKYSDHMCLEDTCAIDIDESERSLKNGFNNLLIAKSLINSKIPFFKLIIEHPDRPGNNPNWLHISYSSDPIKQNQRLIFGVSKNNPNRYIRITQLNKKQWGL